MNPSGKTPKKHIVIDARIRRASTGRPVARLLEHLQEIDTEHRYTILLEKNDDWKPVNKSFKTEHTRFRIYSFNLLNQLLFARQLYRLQADLVHFTLTPQQPYFYFKRQTTFTHDLTMLKHSSRGKLPGLVHAARLRGYRILMWAAHKKANHILVPTEYVADVLKKHHLFVRRKVTVALEASEPPLPGKSHRPEHAPSKFIMYTGSAFQHKNLERLIMAFVLLKNYHQDLHLVLVGKREWHSRQLERWVKKHTSVYAKDISFTGFISDEELKWYYQNAQAYIFPSLAEGFGLPGLEAMVHGCPVVSSNATCLPEVHGDAAIYFDPLDIQEMAQKIDEVISSEPLRKKLIAKGYANAKRFSWRRFAQQHLLMFKDELGEQ